MSSRPAAPAPSKAPSRKPARLASAIRERLSAERIAQLRQRVEGTTRSYQRIGRELGVSASTVCRYATQEGWRRPTGAPLQARIGSHRERVTEKLWKLTERHAEALQEQPVELTQRSLQPLARLTQILGQIDRTPARAAPALDEPSCAPEPENSRSIHELRDELEAHLNRIMEEEGYGWEEWSWWFEDGGGI